MVAVGDDDEARGDARRGREWGELLGCGQRLVVKGAHLEPPAGVREPAARQQVGRLVGGERLL